MIKFLFVILFVACSCFGQVNGPASIPGLAYYWNFNDVPVGSGATNWADRIQGLTWHKAGGTVPTNNGYGILFQNATDRITNAGATVANSYSIWYVCEVQVMPTVYAVSLLDNYNSENGMLLLNGAVQGNWSGPVHSSTTRLVPNVLYNIVDSQGAIWTNGVSTGSSVSQPAGNFTFNSLANDAGGGDNLLGIVKYVGIWTNYALTATDCSNLYVWTQTNGVTNVTAGLVGWWKLDEGSGTTAADSSGHGYTGTLLNSATWSTGLTGEAVTFNGTSQQIIISNTGSVMNDPQNYSAAAWVKTTASFPSGQACIVGKVSALGMGSSPCWGIQVESSGITGLIYDAGNDIGESPEIQINDNQWHHVVMTVQGGTNLYTYVDGVIGGQIDSGTVGGTGSTNSISIGGDFYGDYFKGSIDDVRVYNRILSPAEVDILDRWRGQPSGGGNTNTLVATTVTLATGSNPSTYGTPVTFTATVLTNGVAVGGVSGETVAFYSGVVQIGAGSLNASGHASYTTTATGLAAGSLSITAVYGGDAVYAASTSSPALSQTVNQATLMAGLTGSVVKNYDGTVVATLAPGNYTLSGVFTGDTVTLNKPTSGAYDTKNEGTGKTVTVTGLAISGASAGNYNLSNTSASGALGTINPALLTYTATSVSMTYGSNVPPLSGSVSGFAPGDTQGNATTGTLTFTTTATSSSPVGTYAINGSGLTANLGNYTFAQAFGNASALTITSVSGTGFSPASIPGLAYYWNFNDVPVGSGATNWADRIQGLTWHKAGSTVPTNNGYGILFQNPTDRITNAGATVANSYSIWYVCEVQVMPTVYAVSLLDNYNSENGMLLLNGAVQGNWSGPVHASTSSLAANSLYNIVDSQGAIWINGVSTGSSVSQPAGNFTFNSLANDAGGGDNLLGIVKYVGIWTNYALTATDCSNLYVWTQTNGVTNVTNGLLAWWKLDEGSGTTTADASSNGYTGALFNSPTWITGEIGNALTFNGTTQYGYFSNTTAVADNLPSFSVSIWLKTTFTGGGQFMPLGKIGGPGWYVQMENPGKFEFVIEDGAGNWLESYGSGLSYEGLNDGNWHHLVGIKVPGNQLIYEYLDGVRQTGLSSSSTGLTIGSFSNAEDIYLAEYWPGRNRFPGSIDDVRIYNRVLTPLEVDVLCRWRGQLTNSFQKAMPRKTTKVSGSTIDGVDTINYGLSRPSGLTPNILPSGSPISITRVPSRIPGGWLLNIGGRAGQSYRVLVTENLKEPMSEWKVLTTGTFGANGVTILDTSTNFPARFYRIVVP